MLTALIDADKKKCSLCNEEKDKSLFHNDKKSKDGKGFYCKECANRQARLHHKNREKDLPYKRAKRDNYTKHRWGMSLEQYETLLSIQGNRCAICRIELPTSGFFTHLDHNHETGMIREFLCTNCNRGLGHFQDNIAFLSEAVEYLKRHTENGTQKEDKCL